MESLADKLKSLGVQKGGAQLKPPKSTENRTDIADFIEGRDFITPFGSTFVVEKDFSLDACQDMRDQIKTDFLETIKSWAGFDKSQTLSGMDLLFLDTETSGLAGGTGTFAFLIGIGYFTSAGFHVIQLFMRDPSQETALLSGLANYLGKFRTIVTFNGKSFDVPLLNTRHVINGFTNPLKGLQHIDLLPLARRIWKNRLASRALKDLETEVLQINRSEEEVPGWMIPEIYYDYLRTGDPAQLASVLYHNAQDILSLGILLDHLAHLISNPLQVSPTQGLDLIAIAKLYEDQGRFERAAYLYEHSLRAGGLPLEYFLDTLRRFANLYRKQGDWNEAVHQWEKLVEYHQVDACIELAKHMEHRTRDYSIALRWVETGLGFIHECSDPYQRKIFQEDLSKRQTRLHYKTGKG